MPSFLQVIIEQNLWDKKYSLTRGDCICREGNINPNVYFVKEGALKLYILDEGEEHIIRFAYKNEFAIALDSFFSNKKSLLYIEAIKKSIVFSISKEKLYLLINGNHALEKEWVHILENLLVQQFEREVDLRVISPERRYQRVLQRSPQLFQKIPLKYIANYLRMAPETLSRLRNS
jgi:CRP-like cAMP-binding protein